MRKTLRTQALSNLVRREFSKVGCRIFRNNVGLFYTKNGTPVRCGLVKGSSDFIGWKQVTITPDMVGKTVSVFCAVEIKTGNDKERPEQVIFRNAVLKSGGIAVVIKDRLTCDDVSSMASQPTSARS